MICKICNIESTTEDKFCIHLLQKHHIIPQIYTIFYQIDQTERKLTKSFEEYPHGYYKNGLQYITIKIDKKFKRVPLHKALLCNYYNRELEEYEVPYHLDKDYTNNSITNLQIFPFAEMPSRPSKTAKGHHSRRKGKRKESEVSQILQEWWKEGEFRPTPSSGGWDKKGQFNMKGDIVATDSQFPFCVEVKNNESWKFSTFINSIDNKSKLHQFWAQNLEESTQSKLQPFTIFTRNHHPLYLMINHYTYARLALPEALYGIQFDDVFITLLDEFTKITREYILRKLS